MDAAITAVEFYLPEKVLTNAELAALFPEWTAARIEQKLGITARHIAAENETSADLGRKAAERLLASGKCRASDIDYVLFCTQSPDYFLPTTACLIQDWLGIPRTAGALDFNLGCSGYVYGLGLAKGLIETNQARCLLLITGETYSKFIHPKDKSVRTVFGDAGAATLITAPPRQPGQPESIGPFVFGTDGRGARNLIVETGGLRQREAVPDALSEGQFPNCLYMDGGEIFNFTLDTIPAVVQQLLEKASLRREDVDLFVFHQANKYLLDFLRTKCRIPEDKFAIYLRECGNTVSCSIPIAIKMAVEHRKLPAGSLLMLVGFGVGYSWAATFVRMPDGTGL